MCILDYTTHIYSAWQDISAGLVVFVCFSNKAENIGKTQAFKIIAHFVLGEEAAAF